MQIIFEIYGLQIALCALIVAIIGILVAIVIPLIRYFYHKQKKIEQYYDTVWKKSSSLIPRDILRERPFEDYYFERPKDELIRRLLNEKKNCLIVGSPLAGKTRALFQALINLKKPYDILIPKVTNIQTESFIVPGQFLSKTL